MEIPYTGRVIYNETLEGFEITIPTKKTGFLFCFLVHGLADGQWEIFLFWVQHPGHLKS
jgi:hypothetical protein